MCCHYKNGNICEPDFLPFEERERRYSGALHQVNATKNGGIISSKDDYSLVATRPNLDIQVDGGIDNTTIKMAYDAGANVFVSGSYLFNFSDYKEGIEILCKAIKS